MSQVVAGFVPTWLPWARISVLAGIYVAGNYVAAARALKDFCIVYGFILTVVAVVSGVSHRFLSAHEFVPGMLRLQLLDMCIALLLLALLWSLRRRRDRMYLQFGSLAARFQPPWLRIADASVGWHCVAPLVGLAGGLCVWVFVRYAGQPVANPQGMLLLWAPLFAVMNAFVEESISRNGLLSSLEPHFGARQAMVASALIFGIGHWNGLPDGATGVLMTSALGYFTAKAMIETKGMFWSWFMHAVPDCVIFYYWGMGALQHRSWAG